MAALAVLADGIRRERIGDMLQRNEIAEPMATQEVSAANVEAREALSIGQVLRRAREIHRQHGGIFGYDFEDWAQAWSELPEPSDRTELEAAEAMSAGVMTGITRKGCGSWLGLANSL
jgi:hypothetical protein